MRENWLDRWVLAGRDPLRPVHLLRFIRLQYAFAVSMVVVLCFNGFLYFSIQQRAHADCTDRNARAALSVRVLEQMSAASRADGDGNQAAVWTQWATVSRQAPNPHC